MKKQVVKGIVAPSNAFVLLELAASLMMLNLQANRYESGVIPKWYRSAAIAYAQCLDSSNRQSVKAAAQTLVGRTLHTVLKSKLEAKERLEDILSDLTRLSHGISQGTRFAPFLGLVAGVAMQYDWAQDLVRAKQADYIAYYKHYILDSKIILPHHTSSGLHWFFRYYVSKEDLVREVIPPLEKAMLRSPEIVFSGFVPGLVHGLDNDIDLGGVVSNRLISPLLSAFKSTDEGVRRGAGKAMRALLSQCRDFQYLKEIIDSLLSALRSAKGASSDFRILIAKSLGHVIRQMDSSTAIVKGLISIAAKEANENALRSEVLSISKHLPELLLQVTGKDKADLDTILKASQDKRAVFRKWWLLSISKSISTIRIAPENPLAQIFIKGALDLLLAAFEEVSANPVAAPQSGLPCIAFSLVAILKLDIVKLNTALASKTANLVTQVLTIQPKPSFFLNPRVYTKLTDPEELSLTLCGVMSVASDLQNASEDVRVAWAQSIIYLMVCSDVDATIRQEAGIKLSEAFVAFPEAIGTSVVLGVWQWLRAIKKADKDAVAVNSRAPPGRVISCLRSITPRKTTWMASGKEIPTDIIGQQTARTSVLLQKELIPGADWIEFCLRAGLDPGTAAREHKSALIADIQTRFEVDTGSRWLALEVAARNAAGTLAFVAPEDITPLIIDAIREDLASSQLSGITVTEIGMAKMPDGVAFVDILNEKTNAREDKNIKDYDVLKWEEELRSQLAQKQGTMKKLNAEQQAKVKIQLAHEAKVRQRVFEVSRNVRRGAALVHGLATGPPTDARSWMSSAVTGLLDAVGAGAALLDDNGLVEAHMACAQQVSGRLGTLREAIGIATLRTFENVQLPRGYAGYESEELSELVTRVLYRIRFASEQRSFDAASLSYMLPLVLHTLQTGGVGSATSEDLEAQVLLALEFLNFHTGDCSDPYLPRYAILSEIISSLRRYPQHYRLLKDMLLDFSRSVASSLTPAEQDLFLDSLKSSEPTIRAALLQAIQSELDLSNLETSAQVWFCCHDIEDENGETALAIWEESEFRVTDFMVKELPQLLSLTDKSLRICAGKALAEALAQLPSLFSSILETLKKTYHKEAQPPVPKRDKYGIIQRADLADHWERRSGLAAAYRYLAPNFPADDLVPFMEFMINSGALADRSSVVRQEMLEAGAVIVKTRGAECLEPLMGLLGSTLDATKDDSQGADWLKEAVIILYGTLAQNLAATDSRIQTVIQRLIEALKIPSEQVQYSVAGCLGPLARTDEIDVSPYISQLLEQLLGAKQFAARRGAAYGIAGIAQGRGLLTLRQYRVMTTLASAVDNKKSVENRQGALFAYETLSMILGGTFEPYVIQILPQLLACFGDASVVVRDACLDAAKACFSSLSSFGVHQVLPRLLEGLGETQWRSKKGACELLGAMAYLDSQQLANSLPEIIPPLTAVLTDSHKEVRAAANSSLQRFGEVITNPEVKSLVNILLKALSDPTKYTEDALDGLIRVSFVHYLDAPSLALVVRILERGLGDRSSTKRKSAQIIGSLAHLTERRDLAIHLPILVIGLRTASIDAVPATRATASKALGSLVEKLGEDSFPDLIPSLMASLRTDTGASDRLGSAQALSEVLAGLGTSRLEDTLPTILQNASSQRPTVREGFMTLFIFLPACFGNSFANYLSQIIPSILGGLADDVEAIREISLRAGRLLVKNFATKAIDLLLPELQRGLADDNHRIRLSSVELVGDLLFSLTGISQDAETEEEMETAAQAGQSLLEVLGEEKRDRVLSSLYICRCDTSGLVRTAAIAVWKALVATPRTLREIVPTLTEMIINRLASTNMEQKVIAGNALGEVIRKAGEGVFASLLPTLEQGLETSNDPDYRQGICIALREIINAAQRDTIEDHDKKLVTIVRIALIDSDAEVRDAAAESFDALQHMLGKRVVDQVLPHLLTSLRSDEEAENALSALLTLLTDHARANIILPNLLPTLLTSPMSSFNAKALGSLAEVAGESLSRRLPTVLNTLADNIVACKDDDLRSELENSFDTVLVSVDEFDGLNAAMSSMLTMMKDDDHLKRAIAATRLSSFFASATVDFSRYNQDLVRVLLMSFDDRAGEVVQASWEGLSQLQKRLRKEEMESLVPSLRQVLLHVGTAGSNLPGFGLPKGIQPVLAIFLQGLLNGTAEQRLQASLGIVDLIDKTSADSLKVYVTQITGPLIRVVSERSTEVKTAVMLGLNALIEKIPTFLRPFYPQLQRTFTKSIGDPNSEVLRSRATKALTNLIPLIQRVDPLITELVIGAKIGEPDVKNAMLKALQETVSRVGANMSTGSRDSILALIDSQHVKDDGMMATNSRLLGAMIKVLPLDGALPLIKSRVLTQPSTNASILTLNAVLVESPYSLEAYIHEVENVVTRGITGSSTFIQHNAILAAGKVILAEDLDIVAYRPQGIAAIVEALATVIAPGNDIDARRLSLVVARTVARHHPNSIRPHLHKLAPPVFAGVRDPVIPVKLAAEACFLELFEVVDEESRVFEAYAAGLDGLKSLPVGTQRAMTDYFRRVALRLAAQARERREAEGGAGGLGLSSDEAEDEKEIWSVGRVEVGGEGGVNGG